MKQIVAVVTLLSAQGCVQEDSIDYSSTEYALEPPVEIVTPITGLSQDEQDLAIEEVARITEGRFADSGALLRYEPVLIDPADIIIGDLSQQGAVADRFMISLFGDVSFDVIESRFRPLDINNQASWQGTLKSDDGGKVSMFIQSGEVWPPSLVIRIHAYPKGYTLIATDNLPYVYAAVEIDVERLDRHRHSR